jgi:hypothetical protein
VVNNSGYISFHNTGKEVATLKVTPDRALGLTPGSGRFIASSPMKSDINGLKESYAFGESIEGTLASSEVRILNFDVKPVDWSPFRALRKVSPDDARPKDE